MALTVNTTKYRAPSIRKRPLHRLRLSIQWTAVPQTGSLTRAVNKKNVLSVRDSAATCAKRHGRQQSHTRRRYTQRVVTTGPGELPFWRWLWSCGRHFFILAASPACSEQKNSFCSFCAKKSLSSIRLFSSLFFHFKEKKSSSDRQRRLYFAYDCDLFATGDDLVAVSNQHYIHTKKESSQTFFLARKEKRQIV